MKRFYQHIILILSLLLLGCNTTIMGQVNPVIESVSIDENNHVEIQWKQLLNNENETYIISRFEYFIPGDDQGAFQEIDRVSASDLRYVDENSNAGQKKQIYRINLEANPIYESEEMQTIFLYETIVYDECALTNTIKWTSFFNGFEPISYAIKASVEGDPNFNTIAILAQNSLTPVDQILTYDNELVTGDYKFTNVYEYTHSGFDPDQIYTYKVEAVYAIEGLQQGSSSNSRSRDTPAYERPDPPTIMAVSVEEDGSVTLLGEITGSGTINGLEIWRTADQNSNALRFYQQLGSGNVGAVSYSDSEANSSQTAYWYDLALTDYCGFKLPAVAPHRSIFLTAEAQAEESVELSWNGYEGWAVEAYTLFRKIGEEAYVEIHTTRATSFTDNDIPQSGEAGNISYYIVAEAATQPGEPLIKAASNRVSVGFDSELFVPNAFKPGGYTPDFKPISRFDPAGDYVFQVYNRWGQLIFETRDFQQGWDGKYKSEKVSRGTYIWVYRYRNAEGRQIEARGAVTVIY
jgi:gliding motility-associated-like protein